MVMKWLIRLAFPALGVLVMLIFFGLGDPTETTPAAQDSADAEEIPAFEGLVPSPIPTEGPEIVFKWQDSDGGWHYADSPPETGHWNALAIERADQPNGPSGNSDPVSDWQSPYSAPFSMNSGPVNNGS
ncbi:DUF4124 domain-containing protein [Marinobacter confluentis]|uniref:DUF4124 domain-containing protein n=1 Tax=Marinobacter confluentis TaxID=1697557 RepID=A0A4Z1BU59_9GAMM|nr:DUF4124 domain-containing protein [Marinobacter confluentis]TGN38057.1 DUF4124 domain-containing protein [Marinobacter confluentis]